MPTIINDIKLDYKDVLLCPRRSTLRSRAELNLQQKLSGVCPNVDLSVEITFLHSKRTFKGIPLMASNMDGVGTFEMAKALSKHRVFTVIHKYYTVEEWISFATENHETLDYIAVSSGTGDEDLNRLTRILKSITGLSYIFLFVANAYTEHFVRCLKNVRSAFPNHTIIAGDVVTEDLVQELILAGADVVNIGIGAGSVCTTRTKTGVGYPQLSAVIECASAAHAVHGHISADGGVTCVGDFAKALGAGADFVMAGGIFAGHDQGGGEIVETDGKRYCAFYGMCSATAMNKHYGGIAGYRAAEGKHVEIPYKGDVEGTILDILGGLRSTCTYLGASRLQELPERTIFVRCTQVINNIYGP